MNGERLFDNAQQAAEFSGTLSTQRIGKRLHYFASTSSTNDLALQAARSGAPDGTVFIADHQQSGRGRRGRAWESRPGLGLLFSVIVDVGDFPPASAGWIPLAAGLACVRGTVQSTGVQASLKWPNDVVIPALRPPRAAAPGWRKLGGILCESSLATGAGGRSTVVAGIGLNLHHALDELPEYAKAPPTSVRLETGSGVDGRAMFGAVLEAFEDVLNVLQREGGAALLHAEVEQALFAWWDSKLMLEVHAGGVNAGDDGVVRGRFAGLNEHGWLRLKLRDGTERVFADAEVLSVS